MGAKEALTAGWISAALLVLLAGCSTTPEALEAKSDSASRNYAANYQEVYQRLAGTARRCFAGPGTPALSMAVEAALHKELGFGEVRFVAIGLAYSNYFVSAKIEKMSPGSRISVKVNNPMIGERLSKMVFRWADGDQEC
jgi:hypothetical protein